MFYFSKLGALEKAHLLRVERDTPNHQSISRMYTDWNMRIAVKILHAHGDNFRQDIFFKVHARVIIKIYGLLWTVEEVYYSRLQSKPESGEMYGIHPYL